MPDEVAVFAETKRLMRTRYELYRQGKIEEMEAAVTRLEAIQAECDRQFPLDDQGINQIFTSLQACLETVYRVEKEALSALQEVVS
jgi:fido (protein-threonine AMPylation protein)